MDAREETFVSMETHLGAADISTDLAWVDMLRGIAIVVVVLGNWASYMVAATPSLAAEFATKFKLTVAPSVQVFFILSGFGLTMGYLKAGKSNWSWRRWVWRRFTKIVVPYELAVLLSFMLGILGSHLYEALQIPFSWRSLLACLTFTRNFYRPSWAWNAPLWFMPVMIGLYVSFPLLLKMLEKWGPRVLILISLLVTYGTLTVAVLAGSTGNHARDLFTFWLFQFALGMALAYLRHNDPTRLRLLLGTRAFLLGSGLMVCSWVLRTYIPLGQVFNDGVTSMGIFLILLNLAWALRARLPAVGRSLNALSSESYYMYLIHYPLMMWLVAPLLRESLNPILMLPGGGLYLVVVYVLCRLISKPSRNLASGLYARLSSAVPDR